jgi:hypothetical protein
LLGNSTPGHYTQYVFSGVLSDMSDNADQKIDGLFLRGPIPWVWLSTAASEKGKVLHVAISLWMLRGLRKRNCFRIERKWFASLGVSRQALYKALRKLEAAQLIEVKRRPGGYPHITLINRQNIVPN